jgi:hypothetical protein
MSIKRTKNRSNRSASSSESARGPIGSTSRKKEATWQETMADKPDAAFTEYALSGHFTPGTLLNHLTFGKGLVLSVYGKKMEVLFAEGKKILVMGMVPVRP